MLFSNLNYPASPAFAQVTFFEEEVTGDGMVADNFKYFTGKEIMDTDRHMWKHPVIFLSMKSAKQPDFETAYNRLLMDIVSEFERHSYLLGKDVLTPAQKKRYNAILECKAGLAEYSVSLKFLSDCLEKYHHEKTIILIDEYDVPLENAYLKRFYDKMVDFIRSLLEAALKANDSLQFAVITGCLRITVRKYFYWGK